MFKLYTYIVLGLMMLLQSCDSKNQQMEQHDHANQTQKTYTCPMHPEIVRNEPGDCPICGMYLVEIINNGATASIDSLSRLFKPVNQYVLTQVKYSLPREKEIPVEINATGFIDYDRSLIQTISAKVSGRIEKLYIKYAFQPIQKGDKIMDIYSKELITEQENYIYLLQNDPYNQSLIIAAEKRLLLQGISDEQIKQLKQTKEVSQTISVFSNYTGHLHEFTNNKQENASSSMNLMNTGTKELSIKEGMYLEKGQTIFNVYGTSKVWAILNIAPEYSSLIEKGQHVLLNISENTINAKIDLIEAVYREQQQKIRARVYLNLSHHDVNIGTLLSAKISTEPKNRLFVPASAVIHTGTYDVVFVKQNGLYKATSIKTGMQVDSLTEIISGINIHDTIASNAQFFIDNESFIKAN